MFTSGLNDISLNGERDREGQRRWGVGGREKEKERKKEKSKQKKNLSQSFQVGCALERFFNT